LSTRLGKISGVKTHQDFSGQELESGQKNNDDLKSHSPFTVTQLKKSRTQMQDFSFMQKNQYPQMENLSRKRKEKLGSKNLKTFLCFGVNKKLEISICKCKRENDDIYDFWV